MSKLTDNSRMPWGRYKGMKMANVPAEYLFWCYNNNKCSVEVSKYISENHEVLKTEIEKKQQFNDLIT